MEEKRNYVVKISSCYTDGILFIVKITDAQAKAMEWLMGAIEEVYRDVDCVLELAENYDGEEI